MNRDLVAADDRMRLLAGCLAAGGVFWGLFCLMIIMVGDPTRTLPIFGPGYVVTAGYLVRACSGMTRGWRIAMWGLSALVQGAWLWWFLTAIAIDGMRGPVFGLVCLSWWGFSFAVSVYGLAKENASGS